MDMNKPDTEETLPAQAEKHTPLTTEELEQLRKDTQKKIEKIAFVDVTHLAESEAHDTAEEHLTEERKKTKGMRNMFKRIWKHNIAREWYRQREINKVKKEVYGSENIYAGEDISDKKGHQVAMGAITDRFLTEYEGVIREESGEKKKKLDDINPEVKKEFDKDITELIKGYAEGSIDDASFEEARTRILQDVTKYGKDVVAEGKMYADNLKMVAQQVRQAFDHGLSLESLDFDFDITVGKAMSGVRTEANYNKVDKIIEKVNSTLAGTLLANETSVALGIAIATSLTTAIAQGSARTAGKLAGFFGGMAVSAGIAGVKENMRFKMERAQHLRGKAKGNRVGENSPRRKEMNALEYKTKTAEDLRGNILSLYVDNDPGKGLRELDAEEFDLALATLSEVEGRINVSNKQKIDLISFSSARSVETERTALEIEQARVKVLLRKAYEQRSVEENPDGLDFDDQLASKSDAYERSLLQGDVKTKDRLFRKMKARAVRGAMFKGALSSVIVGGLVHEGMAFSDDETQGALEHVFKGDNPDALHETPIEHLRSYLLGTDAVHEHITGTEVASKMKWSNPREHIFFPGGTSLTEHGDGTVTIVREGKVLGSHIPFKFDEHDMPTSETKEALQKANIILGQTSHTAITSEMPCDLSPEEYVAKHPDGAVGVKRDLWYDNDTKAPIFEKNELGTQWGGVNNTGIDKSGNYVFNIRHMTADGSAHGQFSADAKALMEKGNLKLLLSLSKNTQNQVFEVNFDKEGNAIIDPNSEIGKVFFSQMNGKAVFNGQYAEVAQVMSNDTGTEHVRVLSTVTGRGVDMIKGTAPDTIDEVTREFMIKDVTPVDRDMDIPYAIPLRGRRPLEPLLPPRVKTKNENNTKTENEVDNIIDSDGKAEEIPPGGFTAEKEQAEDQPEEKIPKKKETYELTKEEYAALKSDLEFINKKIRDSQGVITLRESDLKSQHARKRYGDLNTIAPGIPVTFNKTELQTMGNELESILSGSKIIPTPETKDVLTQKERNLRQSDIERVNQWYRNQRQIFTVDKGELKSAYARSLLTELQKTDKSASASYKHKLLLNLRDEIKRSISNSLVKPKSFVFDSVIQQAKVESEQQDENEKLKEILNEVIPSPYREFKQKFKGFETESKTFFVEGAKKEENRFTYDPNTGYVLPYREGWKDIQKDPSLLKKAFTYDMSDKDLAKTPIDELLFAPARLDKEGNVISKGFLLFKP